MWIFSLLVSSMVICAEAALFSQAAGQGPTTGLPDSSDEKTTITSKRMTVKNQESRAVFEGAVVLTRGPLIVHSDVMVITFQSADKPGQNASTIPSQCRTASRQSERSAKPSSNGAKGEVMPAVSNRSICMMEALGHVIIEKDQGRATGEKAVYYVTDKRIVLSGNPVACQGGTRVSGTKITMFLDEDRSEVEGGSQVTINPDGGRC